MTQAAYCLIGAVGTDDAWTLGAGVDKAAAVYADDADTGYIKTDGVSGEAQTFTMANLTGTVPPTARIEAVIVAINARMEGAGSGTLKGRIRNNGSSADGNFQTVSTQSYDFKYGFWIVTNPFTGVPWTKPDVDGLQAGVYNSETGEVPARRVTVIALVINYTMVPLFVHLRRRRR